MKIFQKIRSVRSVLTLWYSLILIAALTAFGIGVYLYLQRLERAELERNLREEVDWISRIIDVERGRLDGKTSLDSLSSDVQDLILDHFSVNPRNYIVSLSSTGGVILYESDIGDTLILNFHSLPAGRVVLESVRGQQNSTVQIAILRADPFIIQVAYPERGIEEALSNLLSIYAVIAPLALFVAVAGGWFMAGVALRPISDITTRANRITVENLKERIPPRDIPDEIGALITTINQTIGRLDASFSQMKELFVSIAHELKTPLTIMRGEAELALTSQLTSEEVQQLIGSYLEEIVRISRIVDDLLTIAKAGAGQLTIEQAPVDIDILLKELHEDAAILTTNKQLGLDFSCGDTDIVLGDVARLRQLFRALMTNAIQYTPPAGRIGISCRRLDGTVSIEISDTGIGIHREEISKIFDPFYRGEDARQRAKGGSGLGLSIAKWIVEAHHGSIAVESSPGKGTRFTVLLPLAGK